MSGSSRRENITITPSYEFDIGNFNKMFNENIERIREERDEKIQRINQKFAQQHQIKEKENIFDVKLSDMYQHFQTSMNGLLDDLINFKFNSFKDFILIFMRYNRLFYLGFIFIFVSIIIMLVNKIRKS